VDIANGRRLRERRDRQGREEESEASH
jgi:hypothetical protein